ncbi:hypothetical protein [Acetobacter peroxydans]|uniref:TraW n=1 Tax=Acetobacter peroxydans TaxID=104098 RepID=A0A4Y3TUI1_9PROT|nr:hypothetical protein [Acetobacter peroxydans]NHO17079.1 hypothetical protein [Acetobacter peroxydans]GEB86591.1 hypothetical protein APE01nite_23880 [Acetobacter peroxydans]
MLRPSSRLASALMLVGAFFLGQVLAPAPARAFGFDIGPILGAISTAQGAITAATKAAQNVLNGSLGLIDDRLGLGVNQITNYLKGQVGAQQQIADANNMVQAELAKEVRHAEIQDLHAVNRQDCLNLAGGQAQIIAARKSGDVALALDVTKGERTRAEKGTPSWAGGGQGAQANNNAHFGKYCDDAEADAGLCTVASDTMKGADQAATSLFTPPVYTGQEAIDRANAYAVTLIEPVAPAAQRGSAITSTQGQQLMPFRRSYNAAMHLSHMIVDHVLSQRAETVTLTAAQKAEAQREGITVTDKGSSWEETELEVNRKYSGTDWQADLQAMSSDKSVLIQIALLDAQRNYLLWNSYKLQEMTAVAEAKRLAIEADEALSRHSAGTLPVPNP